MKHSRIAFEAWLAPYQDEETVGIAKNGRNCPLARYYQANGFPHAFIDDVSLVPAWEYIGEHEEPIAAWEAQVIEQVDEYDGEINAGTLREILARIPKEEAVMA